MIGIGIIESKQGIVLGNSFKFQIDTTSSNEVVTLPLSFVASGINGDINWGDGGGLKTVTTWNSGNLSNTFATAGTYFVEMTGVFSTIFINGSALIKDNIKDIVQWGVDVSFTGYNFKNCSSMVVSATDVPDLSVCSNFGSMFYGCSSISTVPNMDTWDFNNGLSIITSFMFRGASTFNQDISGWYTNEFTTLKEMFYGCSAFNQDISTWNTANVTNTSATFQNCSIYNKPLTNWNVELVTDMSSMFRGCNAFNQPLNHWITASCLNYGNMLHTCTAFNQDLDNWFMTNTTLINSMFFKCFAFNGNITNWDVGNVTSMYTTFEDCTVMNQNLSLWRPAKCAQFFRLFYKCDAYNQPMNDWTFKTTGTVSFSHMFYSCEIFNQDLSGWNTERVTTMINMFFTCPAFNGNVSTWDLTLCTTVKNMFQNSVLFNQDLSGWDISNVIDLVNFGSNWGVSTANYDLLLQAWALLTVSVGETTTFSSAYTIATSQASRDILTGAPSNWVINDHGGI